MISPLIWAISSVEERRPYKADVAGSSPASPTLERQ
jgi:hypothetical protein